MNRYDRIQGFDVSAGDRYWEQTYVLWAAVRERWRHLLTGDLPVTLSATCGDEPAFMPVFRAADRFASGEPGTVDAEAEAARLVDCVVEQSER